MKWMKIMALLAVLQTQAIDDPKFLRGNDFYSRVSAVIVKDICSDHPADTKVWVLSSKDRLWMNVTCGQWDEAERATKK